MNDNNEMWAIGRSRQSGINLVIRYNTELKSKVNPNDYPIRMGVAVPIVLEESNNNILANLEDKIIELIGDDGVIYLVVSSSGYGLKKFFRFIKTNSSNDFKEFAFYMKRGYDFKELHNTLKENFTELDIQMYAEEDPDWNGYEEYADLRRSG